MSTNREETCGQRAPSRDCSRQQRHGQGGRELLTGTLLQGRYGHLLATPCSTDAFPEQPSSPLFCHSAQLLALTAVGSRVGVSSMPT